VLPLLAWFGQPAWAGGGCHDELTDSAGTKIVLQSLCFGPTVTRIAPGQTVTWLNQDATQHTVTAAGWAWNDQLNDVGDQVSHVFPHAGVFPYFCMYHPAMVGAVVVGDGIAKGSSTAAAVAPAAPAEAVRLAGGVSKGWRTAALAAMALALLAVTVVVTLVARSRRRVVA